MQSLQGRSDVIMTIGVCYRTAKSTLGELETTKFSEMRFTIALHYRSPRLCNGSYLTARCGNYFLFTL